MPLAVVCPVRPVPFTKTWVTSTIELAAGSTLENSDPLIVARSPENTIAVAVAATESVLAAEGMVSVKLALPLASVVTSMVC